MSSLNKSFDYIHLMSILLSMILSLVILLISFISSYYLSNKIIAYLKSKDEEIRTRLDLIEKNNKLKLF
jgi:hypothetical protein